MKPHVLALIPLPAETVGALETCYALHHFEQGPSDEALNEACAIGVRAVVTNGSTGLSGPQMARLEDLEIVCAFGAGYENVDMAAAQEHGIIVTSAPNTNTATVADHALGFMLSLCRGYGPLTAAIRQGNWSTSRRARPTLNGAVLGIIGLGRVGRQIAERGRAFGMRIAYFDPVEHDDAPGQYFSNVVELAGASDFLVASCPGGQQTRHLVNREVLRTLGKSGYFVNCARGSVVATEDLIAALQAGEIAGAGLDVLDGEPEIPATLLAFDNVLMTPHLAGRSPASQLAQRDALLASLEECFAGKPVKLAVNEVGAGIRAR